MANSPLKLTGVALTEANISHFLKQKPHVAWVEVNTEHHLVEGGLIKHQLNQLREHYPVSLHGLGLSLASQDELNWSYLSKLRQLCQQLDACLVSDHLAWSSLNGHYFHQPLPFPYTEAMLTALITRVQQAQEMLGRQILIENCVQHVHFSQSTLNEAEFLNELAKASHCGILLDLSAVSASVAHTGLSVADYLKTLSSHCIQEIHLGAVNKHEAISVDLWEAYAEVIKQVGRKPTIIESNLLLEDIVTDAERAELCMRETYVATKLAG